MIQIEDVSFRYADRGETLSHVNLKVNRGECILLCGESGCGKTTVTKLINGLIPHFVEGGKLEGRVRIGKQIVAETEMYQLAELVGSVFQNPKSQFFNVDSDSEIVFGLENAGIEPEQIERRFQETVKRLRIQKLLGKNIFSMSGGEKQTLAFASVYGMNPGIFVLDEPTANLDVDAIDILKEQIRQIKKEGKTVLIAEHRLYFLTDVIDRAIYIKQGRIAHSYTREEFVKLPEKQRISMGLRSLIRPVLDMPAAEFSAKSEGLSVEKLSYACEKNVVFRDISFCAQAGEIVGIIGHNGAGKTTLIRCLCGLLKESSGTVRLDGRVLKTKQRNQASFCVMQDVNHQLFSDSVWAECESSQENVQAEKIEKILRAFDLYEYKDQHPMALSGGQKQRLAVASALLCGKRILIFDEPTSGLDYRRMSEVSEMIRSLRGQDKILLIVSHDYEFLGGTCDKIFCMEALPAEKKRGWENGKTLK